MQHMSSFVLIDHALQAHDNCMTPSISFLLTSCLYLSPLSSCTVVNVHLDYPLFWISLFASLIFPACFGTF